MARVGIATGFPWAKEKEEKEKAKFLDAVNLVSTECLRLVELFAAGIREDHLGTLNDCGSILTAGQPANCLMFDAFEMPNGRMNV